MLTTGSMARVDVADAAPPRRADVVKTRLQGTVWQRSTAAHLAYGRCIGIGQAIGRIGISADTLTYFSLALSLAAGVAAATGHIVWAAGLVVLSGAFDALDGVVARATNTVSKWGALLDSTVDRLADALPLLGVAVLYFDYGPVALAPLLAVVGGFLVSYVRARAEALGGVLPALFMRRAERVVLLTASLLAGAIPVPAPVPYGLLLVGVFVLGVLNFAGVVVAMRAAKRALSDSETTTSAT